MWSLINVSSNLHTTDVKVIGPWPNYSAWGQFVYMDTVKEKDASICKLMKQLLLI